MGCAPSGLSGGIRFAHPALRSLIVIHFVVGEAILPSTVVGLVLIVSGILLQHYGDRMLRHVAR
jgi:hypothetical protein